MFNCTRIHAIGYYDEQAAEAVQMQASRGDRPAPPLGYYDNEVDLPGILYKIRHAVSSRNSPFDAIRTGDIADSDIITRLAAGQDPRTGKQLTRASESGAGDNGKRRRRKVVGYDLQISAPKSVSVLYALGSAHLRGAIQSAHGRAFLRVLRYIETEGLIITRTGARSHRREPASETVSSLYTHILSRDLDPQLHTHGVILNICVRPDGKIGAIDNHRLKQHGGAIAALYRCELADILRADIGLEVVRDARNFKLTIVPDAIARLFSKRRVAIEEASEAAGINTATDRKRAQKISNATRATKKKGLTLADLTRDWALQAREAGFDHVSALAEVEARLTLDEPRTPAATYPPIDADRLIDSIFANNALQTWPQILRMVAEELQVNASVDAALVAAESVRSALVAVDKTMEGDAIYTSKTLIRAEHDVLRMAQAGRGRWHGVPPTSVEAALAKDTFLSAEQRAAIAHALNDDAVVAIEGPPGAGKSHMTAALHLVAKAAGLELRVTSVSWQATHVVRRDAGIVPARASALTPLLLALEKGKQVLTAQDVVIVDEAGMAGLVQIAALARYCDTAGAKLILLGDTRQLQPVSAGAPMRALTQLIGHGALHTIRRQEVDWMRQASMNLAAGRASPAIDSYDAAGAIALHTGRHTTLSAATEDYLQPLLASDQNLNEAMRGQLLITSLNDDVEELNRLVRDGLRQADRLGSDEFFVPAIRRHVRDGQPVDLPLSRGDRIIFGERVELGTITLYNADLARVMWIERSANGPIVTLALDRLTIDGAPISFRRPWNEIVSSHRQSDAPIAQHAYATTVHAAQGATVERTIVAMTTPMSAEPLFVAMTRHRKALTLHVDTDLGKGSGRSGSIEISQSGRLRGTDETLERHVDSGEDGDQPVGQAALVALKRAAMTATAVDNPSRYIHDIKAWISCDNAVDGFRQQLAVNRKLAEFKSSFQSQLALPNPIELHDQDALALSPLELRKLDRVPLSPARIAHRLWLTGSPNGLHRPDDRSEHLRIVNGEPRWSAAQLRKLVATEALHEHPIIQIAVVMLRKSVHAARAFVRAAFRLPGLNPLAEAVSRREGLQASPLQMPSMRMDAEAPASFERVQARRAEDERDADEDRQRHDLWLQLSARWQLSQARAHATVSRSRSQQRDYEKRAQVEDQRQGVVARSDLDQSAAVAKEISGSAANGLKRSNANSTEVAMDAMLSRSRLLQQQQEEEEAEDWERRGRLLAITKAASLHANRHTQAPLVEASHDRVAAEPASATERAAPPGDPVAPATPSRPRVSSRKDIAARVAATMREYRIDPFALPASPASEGVTQRSDPREPSSPPTEPARSTISGKNPRQICPPPETISPSQIRPNSDEAVNPAPHKAHPGQAPSPASASRPARKGSNQKGRE